MGWDRIRFYEARDSNANLISGDKQSRDTVLGKDFRHFLQALGFQAKLAFDDSLTAREAGGLLQLGAKPITYPEKSKIPDSFDRINIGQAVVEVQPPIDPIRMQQIMRYLDIYCDPSDAGPLYLEHRGNHNGCGLSLEKGSTPCTAE